MSHLIRGTKAFDRIHPPGSYKPPGPGGKDLPGWTFLWEDNFDLGVLDDTYWGADTSQTWGYEWDRIQKYRTQDVIVGPGSAGAEGGTSLKLRSSRTSAEGTYYTGSIVSSLAPIPVYVPRYWRGELVCKIPHGHGIWPAWWTTAYNGGYTTLEWDMIEYFIGSRPGKLSQNIHGSDNAGTYKKSRYASAGTFFEAPTATPGWHTYVTEIYPQNNNPDHVGDNVIFNFYVDGALKWTVNYVQSTYWTNKQTKTKGHRVYIQVQIGGRSVGHPNDPLGYSRWKNNTAAGQTNGGCIISGTAPDACSINIGGYTNRRGDWGTYSSTDFEVARHSVWIFDGF